MDIIDNRWYLDEAQDAILDAVGDQDHSANNGVPSARAAGNQQGYGQSSRPQDPPALRVQASTGLELADCHEFDGVLGQPPELLFPSKS